MNAETRVKKTNEDSVKDEKIEGESRKDLELTEYLFTLFKAIFTNTGTVLLLAKCIHPSLQHQLMMPSLFHLH
nr:hypothetical protein CFP56_47769 [Quercus suber]